MIRRARRHLLTVAACIAIGGWAVIGAVWLWWQFQPVTLPTVTEPIPILNPGRQIAVGDPIIMRLEVDKPTPLVPDLTDRYIRCESGNLVTLTRQPARDLPVGRYAIISDSVLLPAKVTAGDSCQFIFRPLYRINPIRTEAIEWESETFTVTD